MNAQPLSIEQVQSAVRTIQRMRERQLLEQLALDISAAIKDADKVDRHRPDCCTAKRHYDLLDLPRITAKLLGIDEDFAEQAVKQVVLDTRPQLAIDVIKAWDEQLNEWDAEQGKRAESAKRRLYGKRKGVA